MKECNVLIDTGTIGHFIYGIKPDRRHKGWYVTRDGDHGRDDWDERKGSEKVSLDLGNKPDYKGPPSGEDENKENGQTAGPEDGQTKPAKTDHVHHILERKEGEPDSDDELEEGYEKQCGRTEVTEENVGT